MLAEPKRRYLKANVRPVSLLSTYIYIQILSTPKRNHGSNHCRGEAIKRYLTFKGRLKKGKSD